MIFLFTYITLNCQTVLPRIANWRDGNVSPAGSEEGGVGLGVRGGGSVESGTGS